MKLVDLSDAQLLESLKTLCSRGRALLARLLAHLIEVEERRLYLVAACPSMLQFCVRRLGMSEDEACRRIHAARLARRFPDLLVRLERGELTLTTISLLGDALSDATYGELVTGAAGMTKAEVLALLAKRYPRPDVPDAITTIPTQTPLATTGLGLGHFPAPAATPGPQLAPLSETRHKVQFTASDELRRKLERAQDLMRHSNANGDLAVIVERAMDLLLDKLERQRLAKASAPHERRSVPRPSGSGDGTCVPAPRLSTVPRATRRTVFERDGERCTYTDAEGHRCPETGWLQLDHITPRARRGTDAPANLRVLCRAHNLLYAEQIFGKDHIANRIRARRDPRRRGEPQEPPANCELAASGLAKLGFSLAEVRRALAAVTARRPGAILATTPIETIVREALAVLA